MTALLGFIPGFIVALLIGVLLFPPAVESGCGGECASDYVGTLAVAVAFGLISAFGLGLLAQRHLNRAPTHPTSQPGREQTPAATVESLRRAQSLIDARSYREAINLLWGEVLAAARRRDTLTLERIRDFADVISAADGVGRGTKNDASRLAGRAGGRLDEITTIPSGAPPGLPARSSSGCDAEGRTLRSRRASST